jgi:tetratricopeptide (TPR) repeat protein
MGSAPPPMTANATTGAYLKITCAPAAQAEFDRGFFFLHNMDYVSAKKAFEAGARTHPTCAMLHWGVAMSYFQPLWPGQATKDSLSKGSAAALRARTAMANASAIEKDLIAAVSAFYTDADKVDTPTRYENWEAAQRKVVAAHPGDVEAQAFWALSRLATVDRKDKTYKVTLEVAAKLEELLAKRPEHPGLLHYLLHAYDNPVHANKAVGVTRTYEAVAPDAAHALHMPSHIHVRLGNWKEVIDWNIKSAAAALQHPVDGRISRDWLHATDYMVYGYLQTGDDEKAKEAAGKIDPKTQYELDSGPGAYALAATPARIVLERKLWREAAALPVKLVDYGWDGYPWAEAVTHAARGLGAARLGDVKAASAAIAELERLLPKVESPWWQSRIQIERDVIAAWIAHAKKDAKRAESLLRAAAERELANGKDNVEPGHVITAAEELGDWLLENKRGPDALAAYEAALGESPKRLNALYGAARAAEQAKDAAKARRYYEEIVSTTIPPTTHPARAVARAYLSP